MFVQWKQSCSMRTDKTDREADTHMEKHDEPNTGFSQIYERA
jgi:hypothetical protein